MKPNHSPIPIRFLIKLVSRFVRPYANLMYICDAMGRHLRQTA